LLTTDQIQRAKLHTKYSDGDVSHEHDDCIRIAYEWLAAQKRTKSVTKEVFALKHLVEAWAGRYVSQSDVEVAAHLHEDLIGLYPRYNISSRLTLPAADRLEGIQQANKHASYTSGFREEDYSQRE